MNSVEALEYALTMMMEPAGPADCNCKDCEARRVLEALRQAIATRQADQQHSPDEPIETFAGKTVDAWLP